MRRLLLLLVLAAVAALAAAAWWLVATESGFAWAVARLERAAGGALVLENARGRFTGEIALSRLRYAREGATIEAREVTLRLSPLSLAVLAPRIDILRCAALSVTLPPDGKPPTMPDTLALPLRLQVNEARIGRLLVKGQGPAIELTDVAFGYAGSADGHRLWNVALEREGHVLTGEAEIGAARPYPLRASVKARRAPFPAASLSAELGGTLERIEVKARGEGAGGRLDLDGTLAPYAPLPVASVKAALAGLDLHALDPALPRTDLRGAVDLRAADGALTGELTLSNRLPGPYDSERLPVESLRAAVRTDFASVRLDDLRAGLGPGGAVSGTVTLAPEGVQAALKVAALDLARLHARLRATRLAGRVDLSVGAHGQSFTAELVERDMRLFLDGQRAGDAVTLSDARVRARGGEARGRGRIELAGAQAFQAEGRFAGFNPAAWGDFPAGTINGRVVAKGTLAGARVIDAQFSLDPSRLHDAPLAGNGKVSVRGDRLAAVSADLEIGGNRVELRGALGGRDDALTARVDAPRLAAVHPRWTGQASGTVRLTGTLRALAANFDLKARELAVAGWRVGAVAARGEYAGRPDGPVRLAASATGIAGPQGRIAQIELDVEGTQQAHVATLRARDKALELYARARGGWQPGRGWAGTLEDVENRGQFPVKLEAPVAIEAGPGRLRTGAIAARFAGGRLDARESRYEQGRLASDGRFSALPLGSMLALAGLPSAAAGTLRVSGSWALTATPSWNGTVSVRRDSGDLSVDALNAVPLGLETLAVDARVVNDRVEFRGTMRARVATAQVEGSVLPVATPEGERIAADSPLRLAATFEIERLGALSALSEATLQFDGRLRGRLAGAGTLGDPLFNGTIEGDALSIALPQEGVDLRDGELRAELADREVRVRSFSIRGGDGLFKARGTLAHAGGQRAALEWQAERLAVTARPDRRVVITGRGTATLEGGKVSLSGQARADEGVIELRARTLPAPGEDVVIVGRPRPASEATRLRQAALDLALDFGERFRIRGRGLDTLLAGKINVQTDAAGTLVARGTVRAVRGTYTAFGQKLALERGSLVFAGPLDNPGLDIRAMRKMPSVDAGVEVAGTLRSPFVRVVSEPPMPENEALSWLVLGHGPGDATGSDLTLLPLAAAALLGQRESPTTGVARAFGLDSIGMRSGTTAGSQFITFGKRIAEDIYIVYEQSLGATANVLKLEFNLSRRVLLRAETGEISAIGLFYRWAFD